jgi:type VI secretion system secreted protein VgrG
MATADSLQADAKIQLSTDLDDANELLATGVVGQEAISRPYVYTISMVSKNFDIRAKQMLGKMVGIRIKRGVQGQYRGYSGFVTAFSGGELHPKRKEYRIYTMRVVPWLALLDQGVSYRIFQDKDVLQIIDAILTDAIKDMFKGSGGGKGLYYSLRIQSSMKYQPLMYCVQYEETDFNFISRLIFHARLNAQ